MKKLILVITLIAGNNLNAQIEKGTILIDAYYGFPNVYTSVFKNLYGPTLTTTVTNFTATGIGPLGGRAEYLVAEKFGIGLDVNYQQSLLGFTVTDSPTEIYNYKYKSSKIAAMVTFNFHFLEDEKMDAYFTVGAGYKNRTASFESNKPNFIAPVVTGTIIPVAARLAFGFRYFITQNVGLNIALGAGGPLLSGGISFKF